MLLTLAGCGPAESPARSFRLATTTSIEDTGLLDSLRVAFEAAHPNIRYTAVAAGTGEALEIARRGDADATITHDPAAESAFVAQGYAAYRRELMYNDFVIAGPPADPAGVRGMRDAAAALGQIAERRQPFVSRGDDSGTHRKEKALWQAVGAAPSGRWYIEAGAGMGDALRLASNRAAYILTDRGTYLRLKHQLSLEALVQGDARLLNRYGFMRVANARSGEAADSFAAWLLSAAGKATIAAFGLKEFGRPLFIPVK